MKNFFNKDDKYFFIGLFIANIFLISLIQFFIINPPNFIKKTKYNAIEKRK